MKKKSFLCVMFLSIALFVGCRAEQIEMESPEKQFDIQSITTEISDHYRGLWDSADKQDGHISQEVIDQIETELMTAGYTVLNTDLFYPSYLTNTDDFYAFWDAVEAGETANLPVITVKQDGGFFCDLFQSGQENRLTRIEVSWSLEKEPEIVLQETYPVYDWCLTAWDTFCYQIYPEDFHYIKYAQINLVSVNEAYYDLLQKYVVPVGYQFTNMFLCDWNEGDFGQLSFNDVFEYLYWMEWGEVLDTSEFAFSEDRSNALIPSELFEKTVMSYFSITPESLRAAAHYDTAENAYPWWPLHTNDMIHYPMLEPSVRDCIDNRDGTITLLVDVGSLDLLTNRVFSHEVTIRLLEDDHFQYVGNRLTYVGEFELPPLTPRMEMD